MPVEVPSSVRLSAGLRIACAFVLTLALLPLPAPAQTFSPPAGKPAPTPTPVPTPTPTPAPQTATDRLTQANRELIELLKKQQSVLEDIQYDRRLLNRQIGLLEERLETTLQENASLKTQINQLKNAPPPASTATTAGNPTPTPAPAPKAVDAPPPEPATYLPKPESEGAPGTKSWHRLFTLSGTEAQTSDPFHVEGPQWRIVWHNQDKSGDTYKNTSALFINAYPKDDTIPQKVCAKLGSGGDSTELLGPGNYYIKVEASGGKWELAVEDFK